VYRTKFRAAPAVVLAGAMIPAVIECYRQKPEQELAAFALEMSDWLVMNQVGRDSRQLGSSGGFGTNPNCFSSAFALRGLAAVLPLTRHLPDLPRHGKYRAATVEGMAFLSNLQYTAENADHFEPKFRLQYVVGGVRVTPTEGTARADTTGLVLMATGQFLESGAESRE
ncbi:MAG: hypothetical protein ACRCZF_16875, partial [Gemmataceae bacterium]